MMRRRLIIFAVAALPFLLIGVGVHAQQSEVTDDVIAMNCQQSQAYLKNDLKNKDLKTRVDRLRAYQYVHKRVDLFVSRLENHRQPRATDMRLIVSQLELAIASFKLNYETYDAAREKLANLSRCQDNVDEFKKLLEEARVELNKVVQSTKSIETLISERFLRGLDQLEDSLKPNKTEEGQE